MKTDEEIDQVTDDLYRLYGSGTGVLFGIPSSLKDSVRGIVKLILEAKEKQTEENISPLSDKIICFNSCDAINILDIKKFIMNLIQDCEDNYQIVKPNCPTKFIQLENVKSYIKKFAGDKLI